MTFLQRVLVANSKLKSPVLYLLLLYKLLFVLCLVIQELLNADTFNIQVSYRYYRQEISEANLCIPQTKSYATLLCSTLILVVPKMFLRGTSTSVKKI